MKVVETESGKRYNLLRRPSGFYTLAENNDMVIAFVGDYRLELCQDLMKGKRKILDAVDPAGELAVGFTDSSSTLSATPPCKGFHMLMFSVSTAKPVRLTTAIKRIL